MSWLNKAFGAPKRIAPTPQKASDALSVQIDVMGAKVDHLDTLGQAEMRKARAIGAKSTAGRAKATACLKRYKNYQAQITLISKQCDNLETQKLALDMAALTTANLTAMEQATKLTSTVSADYAADVMDDVAAQVGIVAEICEILADPVNETDEDLGAELDVWLGAEGRDAEAAMPDVPTTTPTMPLGVTSDAAQLHVLNAWMT
jgi:hypothetical protein